MKEKAKVGRVERTRTKYELADVLQKMKSSDGQITNITPGTTSQTDQTKQAKEKKKIVPKVLDEKMEEDLKK